MSRTKTPVLATLVLLCLALPARVSGLPAPAWKASPDSVNLRALTLNAQEREWLDARTAAGTVLKAALVDTPDAYEVLPDGRIRGFDYQLLREFAGSLGLRLDLDIEGRIEPFFSNDGTMPKDLGAPGSSYNYTPDLLKTVDLYASPFGISPWRERLMTMVPLFPTRSQLAGRKGEEIHSLKDLDGKRFAVIKDSIQHRNLTNLAASEKIKLNFVYGRDEEELFKMVVKREADYLLDASVIFAKFSSLFKEMSLSPYPEDLVMTGWCVKKGDVALSSILAKFVAASQKSGIFGRLWTENYGMDFTAYVGAVLASPDTPVK